MREPSQTTPVGTGPHEPDPPAAKPALPMAEFVAMVALLISLVALAIDAMLPALPHIAADLGVPAGNDIQWVVSSMFLGLAIGQLFFGPLSDSIGRKRAIYAGIALFVLGCGLSIAATDYPTLLLGRVMQGLGAASSRTVTLALVRDQYQGRAMARVMSVIMSVFILIPAVAPALGQGVLKLGPWRAIFGLLLAQAVVGVVWFGVRQPETLTPSSRTSFSASSVFGAARLVFAERTTMGYTLVAGLVSGAFIAYLISAQQIFVDQYDAGDRFPVVFAVLALAIGAASLTNSALVMRFGMRRLAALALVVMTLTSLGFLVVVWFAKGTPPLWSLMGYMLPLFFCVGIMFGNVNSMAMEPLGRVAGMGAALIGALTTLISLALGASVSQAYNGTMFPLVGGFAAMSAASLVVMGWTERGRDRGP